MTVTKDQAQMLTALAIACRPHRAPTWDEAGVMAALANVRHLSLPEVILRTIRAAADHEVISPGVIPTNGSHAQEQLKSPKWEPELIPPHERCSICSHPRHDAKCPKCSPIDDHPFEPATVDRKRRPDVIAQIVEATKAEVAPTAPPPPPREVTRNPKADAARDALADTDTEETDR